MAIAFLFLALIFIAIGWTARHPRPEDVIHYGMRPSSALPWWAIAAALILLAIASLAGWLPSWGLLR